MTEKQRNMLLDEVSSRLRHGIIILHEGWNYEMDDSMSTWERVVGIDETSVYTKVIDSRTLEEYRTDSYTVSLFDDKLLLRSLSTMNGDEKRELIEMDAMICLDDNDMVYDIVMPSPLPNYSKLIDWLKRHMFDYSGMIKTGLANELPEKLYKFMKL
ncbi:MAG: hypothetical protein J6Y37_01135 [Paludibacteraceae bacterium]|nr:hypothetical protein [Paludibacteraceae bacterium]